MAPKITGFAGNSRLRRVRAAAALAGVELDWDPTFTFKQEWKTPEHMEQFPLGYLPVLEDGDLRLQESSAIAEYGEPPLFLPVLSCILACPGPWISRRKILLETEGAGWSEGLLCLRMRLSQLSLS